MRPRQLLEAEDLLDVRVLRESARVVDGEVGRAIARPEALLHPWNRHVLRERVGSRDADPAREQPPDRLAVKPGAAATNARVLVEGVFRANAGHDDVPGLQLVPDASERFGQVAGRDWLDALGAEVQPHPVDGKCLAGVGDGLTPQQRARDRHRVAHGGNGPIDRGVRLLDARRDSRADAQRRTPLGQLVEGRDLRRHQGRVALMGIEDAEAYPYMPGRHGAGGRRRPRASAEGIFRKPDRREPGVLGGHRLLDALLRRQPAMAAQGESRSRRARHSPDVAYPALRRSARGPSSIRPAVSAAPSSSAR